MKNISKEETTEQDKLEIAFKLVWEFVRDIKNADSHDFITHNNLLNLNLLNKINAIYPNNNNINLTKNQIDDILQILITQGQVKCVDGNWEVINDTYMSNYMTNERNTMKTETKLADPTFIISPETAKELMAIGEYLKNRAGFTLSNEQVIQHLIHMFKVANAQGMQVQTFGMSPGPNSYPQNPNPVFYPPGARWANNPNPNGISFEEAMRTNNLRNRSFNPGSDDNNNMPVNKK